MNQPVTYTNLTIEKSTENDWDTLLTLLKETDLEFWFVGNENYSQFYTVKDKTTNEIVSCFSIITSKNIGILKSFGVKPSLQGKGIGKNIISHIPEICKELGITKLYAVTETPAFWNKTIFKEIKYSEIKDLAVIDYTNKFIDKVPNYFEIAHFYLYQSN